jgi:Spy/CpxP family protein refolding chaperone
MKDAAAVTADLGRSILLGGVMRAMRIAAAALLVLVASTAQAHGGGQAGPGGGQGRMNEMLFKGIELSADQKTKIDSIQAAARANMQSLMQSGGMQDSTTRAKMMDARKKQNVDIRAVLTAEQQVIFDKNLAEMPAPGAGRRPPNDD